MRWTAGHVIVAIIVAVAAGTCLAADKSPDLAPTPSDPVPEANAFAASLYGKLAAGEGNLVFSPCSISTAMAMAYVGAKGKTAEEMAAVMHFDLDAAKTCDASEALLKSLTGDSVPRGCQLSVANALWGQKGYGFLPDFLARLKKSFGAGLIETDFAKDAEGSRGRINAWVEKETQAKIKDLIGPGVLGADTRLVLANAIYFKGTWATPFPKAATQNADFHLAGGRKISAATMRLTHAFPYMENGACQAVEMPYKDTSLAMLLFLPKKADGLADLEKSLARGKLAEWLPKLKAAEVLVALPRFQMTGRLELAKTLADAGMPTAFDPAAADFSGMNGGQGPLFLGAVIHKAFLEVNEEGTEAAAATGAALSLGEDFYQPKIFRADHPFVFLVRDTKSGAILFMGRLANPKP